MKTKRPGLGWVVACVIVGSGCQRELDSPKAQDRAYSKRLLLARRCDAVWPQALRTLSKAGFRLRASDRAGGVASFLWTNAQLAGFLPANQDIGRLTAELSGFSPSWNTLQIESATLTLTPRGPGCEARMSISYIGFTRQLLRASRFAPESSGALEERLLTEIASTLVENRLPTARKKLARSSPELAKVAIGAPGAETLLRASARN